MLWMIGSIFSIGEPDAGIAYLKLNQALDPVIFLETISPSTLKIDRE